MNKTVKMARPQFPRNSKGPSGRVEHDKRGNAIWSRTRADDTAVLPDTASLAIVDEKVGGKAREEKVKQNASKK